MVRLRRQYTASHIIFLAALGLSGWVGLLTTEHWSNGRLLSADFNAQWWACLGLIACARLLAFRVFRSVQIAIDSAFYIAAVFVCGTVSGAILAAFALTSDGVVRELFVMGGSGRRKDDSWWYIVAWLVYKGGLASLVLLLVGTIFGDVWMLSINDATLTWALPIFYITFLFVHYLFAGSGHWLEGEAQSSMLGSYMVRVIGAELVLLPMSLAMVMAFRHQGLGLFLLLGATGLMTNAIFRRVVTVTEKSQRRAEELSTLNDVGRIIAASLERDMLIKNLATVTVQLVGRTSRFMIGLRKEGTEELDCQFFDESGAQFLEIHYPVGAGLPGYVMSNRKPLLIGDLRAEYGRYSSDGDYYDSRFSSWLGIPLMVYDEVVGVLSVQTMEQEAYTQDDLEILTTIADQAAVALENARLYELATVDGLTGLFVRRYFDQRLVEEWERSSRYENAMAVALFDLDHFKRLNDTYGHQTGDEVLRFAASVVRENMRSFDIAARYGGEEFAFIFPRTDESEAQAVAERIRHDLESNPVDSPAGPIEVTVSIGLAVASDVDGDNPLDLVARADAALYKAKALGRNQVVLASSL